MNVVSIGVGKKDVIVKVRNLDERLKPTSAHFRPEDVKLTPRSQQQEDDLMRQFEDRTKQQGLPFVSIEQFLNVNKQL